MSKPVPALSDRGPVWWMAAIILALVGFFGGVLIALNVALTLGLASC